MGASARARLFAVFATLAALCVTASAGEASRNFTTSDGMRLRYIEAGVGETVLFVPGWLMPAEIWRPQINHFAGRYRVIALDPRSQGDSQVAPSGNHIKRRAQDLHELIEHTQSTRVVIVGWSLGVLETLLYVNTYGDAKVAALVLVDNPVGETPPQEGGTSVRSPPAHERELETAEFVAILFKSPQPPEYLAWLTKQVLRTPDEVGASLLTIPYSRAFWRSAVYSTARPLLYVVTASLRKQADTLRTKRKDTTTEVFAKAGHALFIDEPERFNATLETFLDKTLKTSELNKTTRTNE